MRFLLVLFFILGCRGTATVAAQSCSYRLTVEVSSGVTDTPLAYATVQLEETGLGGTTDERGRVVFTDLCPDYYHLEVSYLGYDAEHAFIDLQVDTIVMLRLNTQAQVLERVEVTATAATASTGRGETVLDRVALERNAGQNLGQLIDGLAGLRTIKNGGAIAKPVIHGLTGNRIAVLNNGIVQAGQQWGVDHAPEIDPFTADRIRVVKGVDGLAYGGNTLGGAVMVEPGRIAAAETPSASVRYIFDGNGRGHGLSTRLEHQGDRLAWRAIGTLKQAGDRNTPDYFLRNTGSRERNAALLLEKTVRDNWFHTLYYSYFQTELGILRGAHVGNTTDLTSAIGREEPFFTEPTFTYGIEEPRQAVRHQLWKYNTKYYLTENNSLQFTYAYQRNRRREYDVRRGGRSERPALDLALQAHFFDLFHQSERRGLTRKIGLQSRIQDNDNQPGTGVFPLIPNYLTYAPAAYVIWRKGGERSAWQIGGRYDLMLLRVTTFTDTLPREVVRFQHTYHNYSVAGGWEIRVNDQWQSKWNLGLVRRAPEINELYSNGLHQGVAAIEEGNPDIRPETSLKGTWTNAFQLGDRFHLEAVSYYQLVRDFIYLQPGLEPRLTVRGAFPVFTYEQTDARLAGLDLTTRYDLPGNLQWNAQYALVRGYDRTARRPLIYMPADRLQTDLTYSPSRFGQLTDPFVKLGGRYVFEQTRLLPEQDFLAPPPAYFVATLALGATLAGERNNWYVGLQIDNLLNTRYRDYLNRLRYYADEEGRNIRVNVRWEF